MRTGLPRGKRSIAAASVAIAMLALQVPSRAADEREAVTFNNQVVRILQQSCQRCHRPEQVAPMSLLTYAEARPWAKSIRNRVEKREMPPWSADRSIGEYVNDRSLTDDQIATLVKWVDRGAPEGDPADLPPLIQWPKGWTIGEPDLVLTNDSYRVPARGGDHFEYFSIDTRMKEDRYIRAVEVRPGNPRVVHHVLAYIHQSDSYNFNDELSWADSIGNGGTILTEYAVGNNGDVFPAGTGRLLKRGAKLWLQIHYHPYGEATVDQTQIALKFYPKGAENQRIITRWIGTRDLSIPPNTKDVASRGQYTFRRPVRIISFQPHMHCRGQAMNATVRYPDGRTELLFSVPRYDFNWQTTYTYRNPPLLPAGTSISVTGLHDNTRDNPNNPNPNGYVSWGQETKDEMMHLWTDFVYADEGFPAPVTEGSDLAASAANAPAQREEPSTQETERSGQDDVSAALRRPELAGRRVQNPGEGPAPAGENYGLRWPVLALLGIGGLAALALLRRFKP